LRVETIIFSTPTNRSRCFATNVFNSIPSKTVALLCRNFSGRVKENDFTVDKPILFFDDFIKMPPLSLVGKP